MSILMSDFQVLAVIKSRDVLCYLNIIQCIYECIGGHRTEGPKRKLEAL